MSVFKVIFCTYTYNRHRPLAGPRSSTQRYYRCDRSHFGHQPGSSNSSASDSDNSTPQDRYATISRNWPSYSSLSQCCIVSLAEDLLIDLCDSRANDLAGENAHERQTTNQIAMQPSSTRVLARPVTLNWCRIMSNMRAHSTQLIRRMKSHKNSAVSLQTDGRDSTKQRRNEQRRINKIIKGIRSFI